MTRPRVHGNDSWWGEWVRSRDDLDSVRDAITVHDTDWKIHKYRTNVEGLGTREVHLMFHLETKRFGALPDPNQRQTLFFEHQRLRYFGPLNDARELGSKTVWHFGSYVLVVDDDGVPMNDQDLVTWFRFTDDGSMISTRISVASLASIVRFDIRPDDLKPIDLRRHHKKRLLAVIERTPLGFLVPTILKHSS